MKIVYSTLFLLFFICTNSISQNMEKGFTYLETGKYQQAEFFFKKILQDHPNNKTAKLCYARAVGLNGNTKQAVKFFTLLVKDFPTDFEVKLNYAESLLWNRNYSDAKIYYKTLLQKNNKSFPALLGYANTLSNLKEYNEALIYVNKSLIISPKNKNALVSRKYIKLGLANKKIQSTKYNEAEKLLKENLTVFKNDKETLLNLANLYLISSQLEKARKTYEIIGENPENKLTSLNGIALLYHLNFNNKEALKVSQKAITKINNSTDNIIKNQTIERYVQALIWNKKYALAEKKINDLFLKNKDQKNWLLSLRATLNIYKSNFKKSITDYNLILKKDSTSFDANLGKANALKASGYYLSAYKSAENTLSFYNNQKDAIQFIQQLDLKF